MKVCSRCETQKDEADFYADSTRKDGLYPQCRSCASAAKAESRKRRTPQQRAADKATIDRWNREHPERVALHRRRTDLKRKYGISLEEYEAVLEEQNGGCAICGSPPNGVSLAVDHCHSTKTVRGILCADCNTGLGKFHDNPHLLRRAVEYLVQC